MTLTKDTIVGDVLDYDASCEQVFRALEMDCMGCPSSRGETLETACSIHGVELGSLLRRLKAHLGL